MKNLFPHLLFVVFFCMTTLTYTTNSFAKFTLTPSLSVKEEYNDNLFLDSSNEKEDYITTVSPYIYLSYVPNKRVDINLNYGLDFKFYDRFSNLNNTSLKETQRADLKARINPVSRLIIDVTDTFKRVPVDPRKRGVLENVFFNMTESNTLVVSPYMTVPVAATISATTGYVYTNRYFNETRSATLQVVDSESHSVFLTLNKKFTSRTNGSVKYDFFAFRPSIDTTSVSILLVEYNRHTVSVAFQHQLTPHILSKAGVGTAYFDYDNNQSRKKIFWNIGADYDFGPGTNMLMGASYLSTFDDSAISGTFRSRLAKAYFEKTGTLKFKVSPYYEIKRFLLTTRKDKIYGVILNLLYPLTKRMDILFAPAFERAKYIPDFGGTPSKVRKYRVGTSLDYRLSRKITSSVGYQYNRRKSTIANDEFTNNIVWLQGSITF